VCVCIAIKQAWCWNWVFWWCRLFSRCKTSTPPWAPCSTTVLSNLA
jgi:hypothetical protein